MSHNSSSKYSTINRDKDLKSQKQMWDMIWDCVREVMLR